jgi:hypothetical protein
VHAVRHLLWLSATALVLGLTGCAIPGGASVEQPDVGRYQVEVPFKQVAFTTVVAAQTAAGVTATVSADDVIPVLYYDYSVSSRINGGYVAMPNPPKVYTVRKVPFYKTDPDTVTVHISLHNSTGEVVRASQAVCSFDVDGKTVASTPLNATDLLPGHNLDIQVQGPSLDIFGSKSSGNLTVWLYGVTADKNQTLHWEVSYTVKQENRQVWGEVVGETSSEDEAEHYKNLVEPAEPDALVNPPPGG